MAKMVESFDLAMFTGPEESWRYPTCLVRNLRMDRYRERVWFNMDNISFQDVVGEQSAGVLFCYDRNSNFYMTVDGDARIAGEVGDLRTPQGWQEPSVSALRTYLVRFDISNVESFRRKPLEISQLTESPIQ